MCIHKGGGAELMWSGFKVFRNYVDSKLHFLKKYKKNL